MKHETPGDFTAGLAILALPPFGLRSSFYGNQNQRKLASELLTFETIIEKNNSVKHYAKTVVDPCSSYSIKSPMHTKRIFDKPVQISIKTDIPPSFKAISIRKDYSAYVINSDHSRCLSVLSYVVYFCWHLLRESMELTSKCNGIGISNKLHHPTTLNIYLKSILSMANLRRQTYSLAFIQLLLLSKEFDNSCLLVFDPGGYNYYLWHVNKCYSTKTQNLLESRQGEVLCGNNVSPL